MAEMFLDLTGIEGESLDPTYHDKIEIIDWSWALSNTASYQLKEGTASTIATIQHIVITKICDLASVKLVKYCTLGKHVPSGTIICRKNAGGEKVEYLKVLLTDVMIQSVNWKGFGAEAILSELVTLSFGEFRVTYTLQTQGGGKGGDLPFAFNVQTHEEVT
jgi:type VI secretion system secreted protein Hcp